MNFGSLFAKIELAAYLNQKLYITLLNKIEYFILDVFVWPLFLFRNMFVHHLFILVTIIVSFFIIVAIIDRFITLDKVFEYIKMLEEK